jgi:hypothetical protein
MRLGESAVRVANYPRIRKASSAACEKQFILKRFAA